MANLFNPSSLYELLTQYGAVPQWATKSPYSRAEGEYETDTNRIVAPDPQMRMYPQRATSTLSHEMSHAVQFQLFFDAASRIQQKLFNKEKVTDEERRFLEGAQKMYAQSFGPLAMRDKNKAQQNKDNLQSAISKLYTPEKADGKMSSWDYYRTSPVELQAFGIGRMTQGGKQTREAINPQDNAHLDPSFATEFSILMDQFKKLPEDVKIRPKKRDEFLKSQRAAQDKNATYEFADIIADPFKPSIK